MIDFEFWFLQTLAMLLTAFLIPGLKISGPVSALVAVVALAFVNSHVWDAALFFQLPNTLTLQAGLLVLTNGVLFWILVKLLPGIEVEGFLPALVAPIVFTLCSLGVSTWGRTVDWGAVIEKGLAILQSLKDEFMNQGDSRAVTTTTIP